MNTFCCLPPWLGLITLLFLAVRAPAEPLALPEPDEVSRTFAALDEAFHDGKGYSASSDSATLGWGESVYLETYWNLYAITGQDRWLEKIVDHFDRMIGNLSDHDGDGYLSWQTRRYSTALIRAEACHNRGTATIRVPEAKIMDIPKASKVKGHCYLLEVTADRTVQIYDRTEGRSLQNTVAFSDAQAFHIAPSVQVILTGKPQVGDTFNVEVTTPEEIEYMVHQGMVLTPVSRFIETALRRPPKDRFHHKARAYLDLIRNHFLEGNEEYWLDTGQGAGAYRFTSNPTQRYPNRLLPHNQYLALARVWLILADASGEPLFRTRAEAMARNFKRALRLSKGAYAWNYWDWVEAGQPRHSKAEDLSHGRIDIDFVVEAVRRGVVFGDEDAERFARTLLEVMWNGSTTTPAFGAHVDSPAKPRFTVSGWVRLCRWQRRIATIMAAGLEGTEPGLGKTRQLIALMAGMKEQTP